MKKPKQHQNILAIVLATGGVIFFSVKAIFVKIAYQYDVDAVSLLLLRMLFSLPFYIVIAIITSMKYKHERMTLKQWGGLIVLGLVGYYLASYFDFKGLKYVTASLERLILFIYPTLVVIITAIYYKKPIPPRQIAAIVTTYFGLILVFYHNAEISDDSGGIIGSLLIMGSAFTYALYLVGSGKLIPMIGSVRFTSYVMIVSCAAVILHYMLSGASNIMHFDKEVYQMGIAMAIISTILPSFMLSEAIRLAGASKVAIIGSIGPISTIVLANIFLGERIAGLQWLGTVVVISGVLLVNMEKTKTSKPNKKENKLAA